MIDSRYTRTIISAAAVSATSNFGEYKWKFEFAFSFIYLFIFFAKMLSLFDRAVSGASRNGLINDLSNRIGSRNNNIFFSLRRGQVYY